MIELADGGRRASLALAGAALEADHDGVLWWPTERVLVAADLHLEKGSSFARRGLLLPPYDTAATLRRLAEAVARRRPATVVCLGDSLHDPGAPQRLAPADAAALRRLVEGCDWVWVAGNHDPAADNGLGGRVVPEIALGPLVLRHQAAGGAEGEVSGHYHPKAAVAARGRRVVGRCFALDGRRLILPAFGAYAGGLDVLGPPLASLLEGRFWVCLLGPRRLHALPREALVRM